MQCRAGPRDKEGWEKRLKEVRPLLTFCERIFL